MKRIMKRTVSVFLALAMIVTSITYYAPTEVKADVVYSSYTYTNITDNNATGISEDLKGCQYKVIKGSVSMCQFQSAGFSELYTVTNASAANLSATINGETVTVEGTGIRMYNAADYLTYEYNVLQVTSSGGSATVIIKNPNATGTYVISQTAIDTSAITDWKQLGTKSSVNDTIYYISAASETALMNTNMKDLYSNTTGDMAPYNNNIAAGTATLSYTAKSTVTNKSVIVDGIEYASDNVNISLSNDCVHISQDLFQLQEGETERIFIVTVTDVTNHTYALKVKQEEDPGADYDASSITD